MALIIAIIFTDISCVFYICLIDDKLNILMRVLPRLFGERLLCWTQSAKDVSEVKNVK